MRSRDDAATDLNFRCELWDLTRRRPRLRQSQEIIVPHLKWALYDSPTSKKCPGRPVPVSLTSDLQFLRIGSSVFTWSEDSTYRPVNIFEDDDDYFEDMASCEGYLAVSTRQQVPQEDVITALGSSSMLHEEALARLMEDIIEAESKASSSTKPTTERGSSAMQSAKSASSSNTSVTSSDFDTEEIENIKKEDIQVETANIEDIIEPWEVASSTKSIANSAETSWSEGSTNVSSDEFEDEDQWNDWSDERLMFEEFQEQVADEEQNSSDDDGPEDGSEVISRTESEISGLSDPSETHGLEIAGLGLRWRTVRVSDDDDEEKAESASSIPSHYSQSLYSTSGDEEHSDYEHEGGILDNLLFGSQKAGNHGGARRISVRIYDTMSEQQKPIFHFAQYVDRNLFSSPPVFHPSKPLLVWPLGAGEVLFANYQGNTYFTRLLCSSGFGSCQVFVKPHFSSSGDYLHFAALEAQNTEKSEDSDGKRPAHVSLTLQVSTHRLSTRKTVSSPPRLIFRTNVFLGKTASVSVSALPYTLTWTDQVLYFVTRDTKLNVIRIPLFRPAKDGNQTVVCYPRNDVHLPRSATMRDVHYRPPREGVRKGMEGLGTVIIGSYSSRPAQGMLVLRHAVSPPIGVYISEQHDLGGWICKADAADAKQRHNTTGGRLQGKFEHFDRKEDCDIVPFLA